MPEVTASFSRITQSELPVTRWVNDPEYRRDFGLWCHKNFDSLVEEYKTHGRFLSLQEIDNNPIEFSDLP